MIAHDVLTFICARTFPFCDKYINITPFTYSDMDTDRYNPDYSFEMREGASPAVTSKEPRYDENEYYADFVQYNSPLNGEVKAIQVLSLYSAEPDWGMDSGLQLSPFQSLLGGSQGFRHLRYGLFLMRLGIAHQRALYFSHLAEKAFSENDLYWGFRFSARAIHYIEDILTPVHTKPFSECFVLEQLIHMKDLYYTTYNYHLNFERFVAYHLWHGNNTYIRLIEDARPLLLLNLRKDLLKASRKMRRLFYPIFRGCKKLWGESMKDKYVKLRKEDILEMNPPVEFRKPVEQWLKHAASFVKGYIARYVSPFLEDDGC